MTMVSAGAAAGLYFSVKQYSGEQKATTLLETQAGATHKQADALERAARGWAMYGVSSKEGLEAVYKVQSVFGNVGKDVEVMKAGMMGSKIGHANLNEVTDVLTAETKLWASNPMKQMALIEKTASFGKMNLGQLIQGMGTTTLALAHGIGMNQEAALSAIAGVSAILPGSGPETFINLMKTPFIKATALKGAALEAAKKLGLGQFTMAEDIRSGPMGVIKLLQQLKSGSKTVGPNAANVDLAAIFGGARGLGTLETLLSALPQIEGVAHKLPQTGSSELEKNFAKSMGLTSAQLEVFKASLHDLSGEVGKTVVPVLIPALKDLSGGLHGIGSAFKGLPTPLKDGVIGFIALTAVLAPAAFLLAGLAKGLGILLKPLKAAVYLFQAGQWTRTASELGLISGTRLPALMGGLGLFGAALLGLYLTLEHGKHPFNAWEEAYHKLFGGYTAREKEEKAREKNERAHFLLGRHATEAHKQAAWTHGHPHPWSSPIHNSQLKREVEALEHAEPGRVSKGLPPIKFEVNLHHETKLDGQVLTNTVERVQREHRNRR
jgi:hypothetical protein